MSICHSSRQFMCVIFFDLCLPNFTAIDEYSFMNMNTKETYFSYNK